MTPSFLMALRYCLSVHAAAVAAGVAAASGAENGVRRLIVETPRLIGDPPAAGDKLLMFSASVVGVRDATALPAIGSALRCELVGVPTTTSSLGAALPLGGADFTVPCVLLSVGRNTFGATIMSAAKVQPLEAGWKYSLRMRLGNDDIWSSAVAFETAGASSAAGALALSPIRRADIGVDTVVISWTDVEGLDTIGYIVQVLTGRDANATWVPYTATFTREVVTAAAAAAARAEADAAGAPFARPSTHAPLAISCTGSTRPWWTAAGDLDALLDDHRAAAAHLTVPAPRGAGLACTYALLVGGLVPDGAVSFRIRAAAEAGNDTALALSMWSAVSPTLYTRPDLRAVAAAATAETKAAAADAATAAAEELQKIKAARAAARGRQPPSQNNTGNYLRWRIVEPGDSGGGAGVEQPPPLRGASLTAVGAHLYLFGGLAGDGAAGSSVLSADLWRFTPGEEVWVPLEEDGRRTRRERRRSRLSAAAPRPRARMEHTAAALPGGHLVIFGGRSGPSTYLGDTWLWLAADEVAVERHAGLPGGSRQLPELAPLELSIDVIDDDSYGARCVVDVEIAVHVMHPCLRSVRIDVAGPDGGPGEGGDVTSLGSFIPLFQGGLGRGGASADYHCSSADAGAYAVVAFGASAASPPHAPVVFTDRAARDIRTCCVSFELDALAQPVTEWSSAQPALFHALSGRLRPLSNLRARFAGVRAAGRWALRLRDDDADGFTGVVLAWELRLSSRPCSPVGSWRRIAAGGAGANKGPGPRARAAAVTSSDGSLLLWGGVGEEAPPLDGIWRLSVSRNLGVDASWVRVGRLLRAATEPPLPMPQGDVFNGRRDQGNGGGGSCSQTSAGARICAQNGTLWWWDRIANRWAAQGVTAEGDPAAPPHSAVALSFFASVDSRERCDTVFLYGGGAAGSSSGASGLLLTAPLPRTPVAGAEE